MAVSGPACALFNLEFFTDFDLFLPTGSRQSRDNNSRGYFVDYRDVNVSRQIGSLVLNSVPCYSILPPNSIYLMLAVENCVITGGYFLSAHTLSSSLYGLIHSLVNGTLL